MGKLDQPTHSSETPTRKELDSFGVDMETLDIPDPIETALKHYGEKIAAFNERMAGLSPSELMAQYPEISQIHDTIIMAQRYADAQMEYVSQENWAAANDTFGTFFESETFRTYEKHLPLFEEIDRIFAPLLRMRSTVETSMQEAIDVLSKNETWYYDATSMEAFNKALNAIRIYKLALIKLPNDAKEAAPAWLKLGPNYGIIQKYYDTYTSLVNEKRS